MDHVKVQLANPHRPGTFHNTTNGVDRKVAEHWEKSGRCRIVKEAKAAPAKPDRKPAKPVAEPEPVATIEAPPAETAKKTYAKKK